MAIIGAVFARGGSKRIKNKNLKNFFGKPLIYYPIHAAQKSKIFDKIHVSSDSIKILKYSKKLKTSSDFKRPSKLLVFTFKINISIKFFR